MGSKFVPNVNGHMTKMATMPILGKTLLISSTLEPKGQWPWDLVCSIGDVGPTRFAQRMNLDWPWSFLPQSQIWFNILEKSWNVHFSITVWAEILAKNVKPETLVVYKHQRSSCLTFDLSSKATHIGLSSTYLSIFFSEFTEISYGVFSR